MRVHALGVLLLGTPFFGLFGSAHPALAQHSSNTVGPVDGGILSAKSNSLDGQLFYEDIEKRGRKKIPSGGGSSKVSSGGGSSKNNPGGGSSNKDQHQQSSNSKRPKSPDKSPSQPPSPPKKPGGRKPPTDRTKPKPKKEKWNKDVVELGECGTQNKGAKLNRPAAQSSSSNGRGRSSSPKDNGRAHPRSVSLSGRASSGRKTMEAVCGVEFKLPKYPRSGQAINQGPIRDQWEPIIEAFNAVEIDPCKDNYEVGKKPYPNTKQDGVHGLIGKKMRSHDSWQTEHIIDVQVITTFFKQHFDTNQKEIPTTEFLPRFRNTAVGTNQFLDAPTSCDTLVQFWRRRWNEGVPNAMTFLLEVFPGDNEHGHELVLFPGRLNNKKQCLMNPASCDVIGADRWKKLTFHSKIDELREMVLLAEYFNAPKIAKSFKRLTGDISKRLAEIEDGADARMRQTDDFWFHLKGENDEDLKDRDGEKYESLGLSQRWDKWIYTYVKTRCDAMHKLQLKYHKELVTLYEEIQKWPDFKTKVSATSKTQLQKRMKTLAKNINTKVDVSKLVNRPANMPPSRQNSGTGSRASSPGGTKAGSRNSSPGRGPSNS